MPLLKLLLCFALLGSALAEPFKPKFYAFQNGLGFDSMEKEAAFLKEIGFDGVNQMQGNANQVAQRIAAYDKAGLHALSVYLNVNDQALTEDRVKALANRNAIIELTVQKMTPKTVEAVRQTAAMAEKMKIKVALYPHNGFAIATMPQALDLIEKVDHPNLGVMFNLCHFLKNEDPKTLESVLKKAGASLFAVSTSGASIDGKGWGDLIQTLDKGNFPQERLFKALKDLDFKGPVGLQCYAIKGDKRKNLENSMTAWKSVMKKLQ